jgi:hypothetical protein
VNEARWIFSRCVEMKHMAIRGILVENRKRRRPMAKPENKWENNIKMDLNIV